jgi:selenocysteine-specific elongation factor
MGRVVLLEVDEAQPGERANVQILLEDPVTAWPGDHYVVRSYSPVRTIGGGCIYNPCPGKKRRRFNDVNRVIFDMYKNGAEEDHALFHIQEQGFAGLTFSELEVRLGCFGKRLKKILNTPVSSRKILVVDSDKQRMITEEVYLQLNRQAKKILSAFHAENPMKDGISKEELRSRLYNGLDPKLFQLVLTNLIKEGSVIQDQAIIREASHQVSLQADAETVKHEMENFYLRAGLSPPTLKELMVEFSSYKTGMVKDVLELLTRDTILVKISEDLYYHAKCLADLKEKMVSHLTSNGEIDAQAFKAMTGLSRKFSIPLLEYFDKLKLTIRIGDKRVLR